MPRPRPIVVPGGLSSDISKTNVSIDPSSIISLFANRRAAQRERLEEEQAEREATETTERLGGLLANLLPQLSGEQIGRPGEDLRALPVTEDGRDIAPTSAADLGFLAEKGFLPQAIEAAKPAEQDFLSDELVLIGRGQGIPSERLTTGQLTKEDATSILKKKAEIKASGKVDAPSLLKLEIAKTGYDPSDTSKGSPEVQAAKVIEAYKEDFGTQSLLLQLLGGGGLGAGVVGEETTTGLTEVEAKELADLEKKIGR